MTRKDPPNVSRRAPGLAVVFCALAASSASAATNNSFDSVVLIRCALAGGEAKATGFVWPEPGYVVTALHAVAGCDEIVIWSEATLKETLGTLLRVDLEADLALLQLDEDLGLAPVRHAIGPPDMLADHVTLGYPLAAEQMIRLEIEFGGGLKSDITTLGDAFASDELEDLFRGQPYPTRDTSILRVNTTIQPGHSGAPIFDSKGDVVAVADGGLLGGWRSINWSIPAHIYLPDLLTSDDPPPDSPSHQAQLFSSITPADPTTIEMRPLEVSAGPDAADQPDELTLVRQFPLTGLAELLIDRDDAGGSELIAEFRSYLGDPADSELYGFDIYEDSSTGATIGVPAGVELYWNDALQALEATNLDGTVYVNSVVRRMDSFADAMGIALEDFVEHIDKLADWYDGVAPGEFKLEDCDAFDPRTERTTCYGIYVGDDIESGLNAEMPLGLHVSGPVFLGTSVYAVWAEEDGTVADRMDYIMMLLAAEYLTDFALN